MPGQKTVAGKIVCGWQVSPGLLQTQARVGQVFTGAYVGVAKWLECAKGCRILW